MLRSLLDELLSIVGTCTDDHVYILTSKLLAESFSLIPPTARQQLVVQPYSTSVEIQKYVRLTSFTGNVSNVCSPH